MGRGLRLIRTFVRAAAPYVMWTARESLWLTALALVGVIRGSRDTSREIAEEWTEKAIQRGVPMQFEKWLRIVCRTTAFTMSSVGWIFLAHLTVFVIRLIVF